MEKNTKLEKFSVEKQTDRGENLPDLYWNLGIPQKGEKLVIHPPKILETRVVFESRKLKVIEQDLEFSNGYRETWEYVELKSKGGVQVMPLKSDGKVVMVREYRGAAQRYVLRFPTGSLEGEESPEQAALRELREETGYTARRLHLLKEQRSSSTYFRGVFSIYLALDLEFVGCRRDLGECDMEVLELPLEEVFGMALRLEIESPQTVYSILMLHHYQQQRKSFL
ncbi:MAG: NUDIX hydrolase [Planctomycetota bacterium]|nr:MAG: NUDIX hydrolase [Planctomycetota bacterium]